MTLTELRYIVTVSKTKHFGKAASKCFVSQPTLSVAIRKLEDELDVEIFERGRSEVNITPIGHVILEQAEKILEEAHAIKKITEKLKGNTYEPIRVSALSSIGPYIYPYIVKEVKKSLPKVFVNFKLAELNSLKNDLLDSHIDFALSTTLINHDKIQYQEVYEEPLVAIIPKEHNLSTKDSLLLDDLKNENVVLVDVKNSYRQEVLNLLPSLYVENNQDNFLCESDTIDNIFNIVGLGSAISIVPYSAINNISYYLDDLIKVIPFKESNMKRIVYCMWRKGFYREYVLNEFLDILKKDNIFEQIS